MTDTPEQDAGAPHGAPDEHVDTPRSTPEDTSVTQAQAGGEPVTQAAAAEPPAAAAAADEQPTLAQTPAADAPPAARYWYRRPWAVIAGVAAAAAILLLGGVAIGTAIGHKKIDTFPTVITDTVEVIADRSDGVPTFKSLQVFSA